MHCIQDYVLNILFCLFWWQWLVVHPRLRKKKSMLRLTQIRPETFQTVSKRKKVPKCTTWQKTILETRHETCCWTPCYVTWWNAELLWGLIINPGRNTDVMWMLQEKLWKMAYLAKDVTPYHLHAQVSSSFKVCNYLYNCKPHLTALPVKKLPLTLHQLFWRVSEREGAL